MFAAGSEKAAGEVHALLTGQHQGITGVNLDEESIKMPADKRAFRANARVITTADERLGILLRIRLRCLAGVGSELSWCCIR